MSSKSDEHNSTNPMWVLIMQPLFSSILGVAVIWYTWVKYNGLVNLQWFEWIRPGLMVVVGILCLFATVLFILGKSSGWSVFMGGLSLIPVILFTNLIILIGRIIVNFFQGNTDAFTTFLDRLYTTPIDRVILVIAILVFIGFLNKKVVNKNSN